MEFTNDHTLGPSPSPVPSQQSPGSIHQQLAQSVRSKVASDSPQRIGAATRTNSSTLDSANDIDATFKAINDYIAKNSPKYTDDHGSVRNQVSFGYIGNLERWGDDRKFMLWDDRGSFDTQQNRIWSPNSRDTAVWFCEAKDLTKDRLTQAYTLLQNILPAKPPI